MRRRSNLAGWKGTRSELLSKAGRSVHVCDPRRIANGCRQPPGTLPIERIDYAFSEVVEVETISSSDGTLAGIAENAVPESAGGMGRVGNRKPRRQISIV